MKKKRCGNCSGTGRYYNGYDNENCYRCKGTGRVAVAKVKQPAKLERSVPMDFKKEAAKIQQLLKNAGVPLKRLPSLEHILSHFADDWIDREKMTDWIKDYSKLEGGRIPKTKKIAKGSESASSKSGVSVGARKIDLDDDGNLDDGG